MRLVERITLPQQRLAARVQVARGVAASYTELYEAVMDPTARWPPAREYLREGRGVSD
jgi:hypothetical protein